MFRYNNNNENNIIICKICIYIYVYNICITIYLYFRILPNMMTGSRLHTHMCGWFFEDLKIEEEKLTKKAKVIIIIISIDLP